MSREDDLRALREARFMAGAKRPLGAAQPQPVAEIATKSTATKPATNLKAPTKHR
jgi:hypothetical protein